MIRLKSLLENVNPSEISKQINSEMGNEWMSNSDLAHGHCFEWAVEFYKRVPDSVIKDIDYWHHAGQKNIPYHVWIEYGGKCYDAMDVDGVKDFRQLDFFKKYPTSLLKKLKDRPYPVKYLKN